VNGNYLRFALALLVSVAGCASAPVRYYTLIPPPDKTAPASQTTLTIDVRVVHTPQQLNRTELMVRTGPAEVTLLENERWTSPLHDEIKNALRLELQRRLSRVTGVRPAWTKLSLDIDVLQLEAELDRYALFEASWSATLSGTELPSANARAASCAFQAVEKIGAGYAGMIEGYQREMTALAGAIADVVTRPLGGIDVSCPQTIDGSPGDAGSKVH
jgi:uncharacterized protein